MRLGTRWTSGEEPPEAVPESLREGIAGVDATIPVDVLGAPSLSREAEAHLSK